MGLFGGITDSLGLTDNKGAKKAQQRADQAIADQNAQAKEALDYAKSQDAQKLGYATDWYNEQRGLVDAEDARRFGLLPQFMDNATSAYDEALTYADDYGNQIGGYADQYSDQVLGDAQGYQSDITGNADRMYDELTGNAKYTDADYADALGSSSADVVQSFGKARDMTRRNAMRYGVNPNSSDFARMEVQSGLDQAKAEAGAQNTTRRGMKTDERNRMRDAISQGLTARGSALTSGYGAVDNATRFGYGAKNDAAARGFGARDNANRYGRGMVGDALNTNLNTRSSKIGLVDPRTGLTSMTLNQMNNNIGTAGQQAGMYNNNAMTLNQSNMGFNRELFGAAVGAATGGSTSAPAPPTSGASYASAGYTPPGGVSQQSGMGLYPEFAALGGM